MIWLSTKEAAELLHISQQAVRKNAREGKYGTGTRYVKGTGGNSGEVLQICLDALPEIAQNEYHIKNIKKEPEETSAEIDVNKPFDNFVMSQKEKAVKKLEALKAYKDFEKDYRKKCQKFSKAECKELFIEKWNNKNEDFQISIASLYRWLQKYKSEKTVGLVDKRGGHNKGEKSIPKEIWDKFCYYYLKESQPSIKSCYEIVRVEANVKGIPIPDYGVFYYHANKIPYPTLVLYREGRKAYDDKCAQYIERDYLNIHSNEIWVADHHIWDEHIVVEEKGDLKLKKVRLWGSYWMDMRSRRIVAKYLRMGDPNGDVVLASFAEGVLKYGIPKEMILDNGKDYKSKDLFVNSGVRENLDFNIKELFSDSKKQLEVQSLALQMDIVVHFAHPYNAKAKPIERTFGTFESQFGKLFDSYLGGNPTKRPERLKTLKLEGYPTFEEYKKLHDDYIENIYNESSHQGEGMYGKSPRQVYEENLFERRTTTKDAMRLWLMRTTTPYTVQRNGIKILGSWYYSKEMVPLMKQKVYARYSPENINEVYIYSENDRYICMAQRKEKLQFGASKEDYKREAKIKKEALEIAKAGKPQIKNNMSNVEEINSILTMRKDDLEKNATPYEKADTVEVLVRNQTFEEAAKKSKLDKKELEQLEAQELKERELTRQAKREELKKLDEDWFNYNMSQVKKKKLL